MKKILLLLSFALLVTAISSCKKIKDLLTFPINNTSEFTIPSSSGSLLNVPLIFHSPDVQSSSSQTFSNNDTRADLVKDVKLTKLDLTITNPSGKTFSFLKSVKIYISGNGLPEKLLASKENITNDVGSTISLETTSEKLDSYLKLSSYSLRYEIITDETFVQDITMSAFMIFTVTADPL